MTVARADRMRSEIPAPPFAGMTGLGQVGLNAFEASGS